MFCSIIGEMTVITLVLGGHDKGPLRYDDDSKIIKFQQYIKEVTQTSRRLWTNELY